MKSPIKEYFKAIDAIVEDFKGVDDLYGILLYGSGASAYQCKERNKLSRRPKDIDLIIAMDFPFIIPRSAYEDVADSVKSLREKIAIRMDLSVCDRMLPGTRFVTWGPMTVRHHLIPNGRTIIGEDVSSLFSGAYFIDADKFPITMREFELIKKKSEARGYMAWSLHSARKRAANYKYDLEHCSADFDRGLSTVVGSVTNFLRDAIYLGWGEWYSDEGEILEAAKSCFPTTTETALIDTDEDKVAELDVSSRLDVLFESLRLREELVRELCRK
jgi:hypothetical protein